MGLLNKLKIFKNRAGVLKKKELRIGDRLLNRYEIREIKTGGMGIVYVVYDHKSKRLFAAKTIKDEYLSSAEAVRRYLLEAETWVKLDRHENIVRAEFIKKIRGKPYIFLEYIDGNSLRYWIDNKLLDLPQILNFAVQICTGMQYAHEKLKIVHRDIKPQNILIAKDGTLKISDFGLVKIFDNQLLEIEMHSKVRTKDQLLTQTGAWGTPAFMSPEQISDPAKVDTRSDIYSFGVVLYEMLTGVLPSRLEIMQELDLFPEAKFHIARSLSIARPREINPEIPEDLDRLVMKCLEREPSKRYQSFEELLDELLKIYEKISGEKYEARISEFILSSIDWNNRGVSLHNLGLYSEALRCFEEALKIDPHDVLAHNNKGLTLKHEGKIIEAINCFERAIELDQRYASPWINKGAALHCLGDYEKAIACFDQALEIEPNNAMAWDNKGLALHTLGKYEEAIACFDQAIEVNPSNAAAWNNKGISLHSLGRYYEATACYDRSLEINPRNAVVWNNKGMALALIGKRGEAIACLDRALDIDPKFEKARNLKEEILKT